MVAADVVLSQPPCAWGEARLLGWTLLSDCFCCFHDSFLKSMSEAGHAHWSESHLYNQGAGFQQTLADEGF